jgi:hypothetical protein
MTEVPELDEVLPEDLGVSLDAPSIAELRQRNGRRHRRRQLTFGGVVMAVVVVGGAIGWAVAGGHDAPTSLRTSHSGDPIATGTGRSPSRMRILTGPLRGVAPWRVVVTPHSRPDAPHPQTCVNLRQGFAGGGICGPWTSGGQPSASESLLDAAGQEHVPEDQPIRSSTIAISIIITERGRSARVDAPVLGITNRRLDRLPAIERRPVLLSGHPFLLTIVAVDTGIDDSMRLPMIFTVRYGS